MTTERTPHDILCDRIETLATDHIIMHSNYIEHPDHIDYIFTDYTDIKGGYLRDYIVVHKDTCHIVTDF